MANIPSLARLGKNSLYPEFPLASKQSFCAPSVVARPVAHFSSAMPQVSRGTPILQEILGLVRLYKRLFQRTLGRMPVILLSGRLVSFPQKSYHMIGFLPMR